MSTTGVDHDSKRLPASLTAAWSAGMIGVALIACFAIPASAGAASFSNPAPITIADEVNASPYPSSVTVSGQVGTTTHVSATIFGFTHQSPGDVGVVLVAPNGEALLLQDCLGADLQITDVTYTIDDLAPAQLPGDAPWPPGSYRPRSDCFGTAFPAPGPGAAYGHPGPEGGGTATLTSTFIGDDPNGVWNLFVLDHDPGGTGSIANGWALNVTSADTTAPGTTITDGPPKRTRKRSARIEFTASEAGATLECKVDDGKFTPCTSPKRVRVDRGRHTFAVRARDAAGNADPSPATYSWRVKR